MWRSPSTNSSTFRAVQVSGSNRGWRGRERRLRRWRTSHLGGWVGMTDGFSLTVCLAQGKYIWVCSSSWSIYYIQTLLFLIHIQLCQLIYFHLPSQVQKFGQVTKSTKKTCPWVVQFLLVSLSCLFSLLFLSALNVYYDFLISRNTNRFLSAPDLLLTHFLQFVTQWAKGSKFEWLSTCRLYKTESDGISNNRINLLRSYNLIIFIFIFETSDARYKNTDD